MRVILLLLLFTFIAGLVCANDFYIGKFRWNDDDPNDPYWHAPAPDKLVGLIDLRPIADQAELGGVPRGYGVFEYSEPVQRPSFIKIGTDPDGVVAIPKLNEIETLFGTNNIPSGTTVSELIDKLLSTHNTDKLCPVNMPDRTLHTRVRLGGREIKKHKVVPLTGPRWPRILNRIHNKYLRYTQRPDPDFKRRMLTVWMEKYNVQDHTIFIPEGEPIVTPLPHNTTITESFNTADSDTLGPDLSWTEISGDIDISSNAFVTGSDAVAGNAMANSDLSTSDNYAKIDVTDLSRVTNYALVGIRCRHVSSAASSSDVMAYGMRIYDSGNDYHRIEKIVSGSSTAISGPTLFTFSNPDEIKIEADGSTIKGYLNGAEVHSVTDTAIASGTRGGLVTYTGHSNDSISGDNFEAGDIAVARRNPMIIS